MKKNRRRLFVLIPISLVLLTIFIQLPQGSLDMWIGEYKYFESLPAGSPDNPSERYGIVEYNISIYKDSNCYYARIKNQGYQTNVNVLAKVMGNSESISLLFESYLPDNALESFKKDDILLSLSKKDNEVYTSWGAMQSNTSMLNGDGMGAYFRPI